MDYVQMSLNDWMSFKEKLKKELQSVKQSFVRIGYALRKIEDNRLYEQDGYKSIAEFAKKEYGLEATTVSRFIQINRRYSLDGYSEVLAERFEDYNRSQLEEMLNLPEEDYKLIEPEMPRQAIRELKAFNKSAPEENNDKTDLVKSFFKDNREILNELYGSDAMETGDIDAITEIVNPAGSRTYRKGLYFMAMYPDKIMVKKFQGGAEQWDWSEFVTATDEIFGATANGGRTWENYFGEPEPLPEPEPKPKEEPRAEPKAEPKTEPKIKARPVQKTQEKPGPNAGKAPIAPAQKTEKTELYKKMAEQILKDLRENYDGENIVDGKRREYIYLDTAAESIKMTLKEWEERECS